MPEEHGDSVDAANFFANILTPGSSLHPTFQLILDAAFIALFVILLGLFFVTGGNVHIAGLIGIELCLWASVKWFVYELAKIPPKEDSTEKDRTEVDPKKTQ
ncbi:hypothetical protein VNI00_005724 [Paramarasmius palmivorus]|uniref:Uncharacterized protein n=1 Tax=Paramarasmius palmivorus TaxID=297713 RepID=A0AAW0DBF4_9AGAR